MIAKLLFNINNLFYYLFMLFLLCVIIYLVYKLFILENDVYIINEKLFNIECSQNNHCIMSKKNDGIDMNEIIMTQIFDDEPVINVDSDIIEIEEIKEPIFDLKKEVITDDKESIISSNLTKKKLQKLNLDKLKEKCLELELNTEGTKSQLIDRILEKELN